MSPIDKRRAIDPFIPGRTKERALTMNDLKKTPFDASAFLAEAGLGRRIIHLKAREALFSQGNAADLRVLYPDRTGETHRSFEERERSYDYAALCRSIYGRGIDCRSVGLRMATATAISACVVLKIEREEMIRVLHEEHAFSDLFLKFLLARGMRTQADLIDQLFNSSEKRLAADSFVDGGVRQAGRA